MSVVVAIKENGVIYMGADTQKNKGLWKIRNVKVENNFKIKKLSNGILIGNIGNEKSNFQLYSNKSWFDNLPKEGLTKKFIVNEIIPLFINNLKSINAIDEDGEYDGEIIIAFKDRAFNIDDKFCVYEITEFAAIGAAVNLPYYLLTSKDSTRDKILNAMRISPHYFSDTSSPFILIDTEKMEYEIVEE